VNGTLAFLFGAIAANNLSNYKAEIHPDLDHILGVQYYIPVAALPSSAIHANPGSPGYIDRFYRLSFSGYK